MNLESATAHHDWDRTWQSAEGREDWLVPEPFVIHWQQMMRERGMRDVLDLGCGVGRHALYFAAQGYTVEGLDGSAAGLDFARRQATEQGLSLHLREGLMTALPYTDASFDAVLAWNVIYHGDQTVVDASIAEIRRVLRPGGLFVGTMLSKRNGKYGLGREVAPDTFVIDEEGDKAHPHFYTNAIETCRLFGSFEPLHLSQHVHRKPGSWHWHVVMEKQESGD